MLGKAAKPFPIIEPFTAGNDPDTKARNAIIAGKITQRVKDESEREKAIITTKASLLSWFHGSLEDYIHSRANPTRLLDWDSNNWTEIMKHIRNWYLEPVSQNDNELTLEEQERLMRDYRVMRQGTDQTLSEWESVFKRLVKLVNERANANKSDLEQAKDFIDKLLASSYGSWKHECHMEENRQQQRMACGEPREKIKGHPQSLEEAIQRAKAVERQNHLREQKREEREEHGNRKHNYHKRKKAEPYSESNAFARTATEDPNKHQYTIQ